MNTAQELNIRTSILTDIIKMAIARNEKHENERALYFVLSNLPAGERTEVYALYNLGRAGVRSFNVALASAL